MDMRYFIELAYRGTAYRGWQTQANGASVQATLEAALTQRLQRSVFVVGSGRTDAGVHAEQQFAHFDTDHPLTLSEPLIHSLNCLLPGDIVIQSIFPVRDEDHARFSAVSRYYQYRITWEKNAFSNGLTYYFRPTVDVDRMNEAAELLLRHRDFKSFSKARANVAHFRCVLDRAYWQREDHQLTFHIRANRFLWGMVRTIVGTMLDIGQGTMDLDEFDAIIRATDRQRASRSAPANGLYLMEVAYPADVLVNK